MKPEKLVLYTLFLICTADALLNISNSGFASALITPISFVCQYISLFILIYISSRSIWHSDLPRVIAILFKWIVLWHIFTIIRGAFLANDYWDWKFLLLSSTIFMLIPLAFFVGKNSFLLRAVSEFVLKYLFVFGFFAIPIAFATNRELYSRLMVPVGFFIILIPYLEPKWRKLIVGVAITSILVVISFRTNIIKIVSSFLLLFIYYFRRYIRLPWIKFLHIVLFALPLVLLFLALTGTFSLFERVDQNESFVIKNDKDKSAETISLTGDTRTSLYREVLSSLQASGNMIIGEGGSGKYKSVDFEDLYKDHRGRYASEVGFLNDMLYSGIIGVLLYALILFYSSYYAIYKSNNFLCRILGLFIAVRWILFFIEEFTQFDLNFYFTWLIIGLVSTQKFRAMSDNDLRQFLKF
jgi:hypothetical protein